MSGKDDTFYVTVGTDAAGEIWAVPAPSSGAVLICGGMSARTDLLKVLAEQYSSAGCPVFLTDCTGTLSAPADAGFPCTFWDIAAQAGLPLRTTATELGSLLLAKAMELNETQSELLELLFRIADDAGLLLIDTKDLKALIGYVQENHVSLEKTYGAIAVNSLSVILRSVTALEAKGGREFLYEPAIDVRDFLWDAEKKDSADATGRLHILDAQETVCEEAIYGALLTYLLSELNERLPLPEEVKPAQKPVLAVLIDEAQLLFTDTSRAYVSRLKKLLNGLREKGVQAVFALEKQAQMPEILQECCGVVLTCADAVQVQIFEEDGSVRAAEISQPAAAISGKKGISQTVREKIIAADALKEKYHVPFERDSAYEFLQRRGIAGEEAVSAEDTVQEAGAQQRASADGDSADAAADAENAGDTAADGVSAVPVQDTSGNAMENEDVQAMAKRAKNSAQSLGTTVAGTVGRQIGKSIGENFGSFGSTLGGNIGASLGRGIMNTLFNK